VQESFVRGGMKRAIRKAWSEMEDRENIPEPISERVMP
jgi:hypothetical protein